MEAKSQTELIATLAAQAEQKRRRCAELDAELREEREAVAYINGQLAILRQITIEPHPMVREGGGDS